MKRALQWILVLTVCASLTSINVAENNEWVDRKLASVDTLGVISIDCGVTESYTDNVTNIRYQADDTTFVQSGQIFKVSSSNSFDYVRQIGMQLNTLRSFPEGKRNCYTMKPEQGKNKTYLTRAHFAYGNYDGKNEWPAFYLYLGVNSFNSIMNGNGVGSNLLTEVIHFASTGTIQLCLVNTGHGVPFISLLELWPWDSSIYQTPPNLLPLALADRANLGASEDSSGYMRYTDDEYGRYWIERNIKNSKKTSASIDVDKPDYAYKLPTEVLSTAVVALNLSFPLNIILSNCPAGYEYYLYLHFFDFEGRTNNQQRIIDISVNGVDAQSMTITLPYRQSKSIFLIRKQGLGIDNISIIATSQSDLPAMLNAYEVYRVVDQPNAATQQGDVDTIGNIKDFYGITRVSWQGDPCGPANLAWEGLTCSVGNNPRIISLNLSSSKLSGVIDASFFNLTYLKTLDLSNNELTGEVPQFFAKLPNLKILNLSRNKLTGSIPEALKAKSNNSLQLRFGYRL